MLDDERRRPVPARRCPERPRPLTRPLLPTGVTFLDEALGGGMAPGEVYVLLGVTGVAKTTLALQLAYQAALRLRDRTPPGEEPACWYFFTYEQAARTELRPKVIAHSAQIHYTETLLAHRPLSTRGNLRAYERERYAAELADGEDVLGEQERYDAAAELMTPPNFFLVDMTGGDPVNPRAGTGGIPEVAHYLAAQKRGGRQVGGYVIDSADQVVDRFLDAQGSERDSPYPYLAEFVGRCRAELSDRFRCPGWVVQQLAGAVNGVPPIERLEHADAAGCRKFADAADFAFVLGAKDTRTATCRLNCTKFGRGTTDARERILFIDGAVSTVRDATDRYALDGQERRIIPAGDRTVDQVIRDPRSRARRTRRTNAASGLPGR
jgi:KaiC